jgi:hypothetical protein
MKKNKPLGPADINCPKNGRPMSKVCHKCNNWRFITGKDPQTGELVDDWDCVDVINSKLLMELGRQIHQLGAAFEDARNHQFAIGTATLNHLEGVSRAAHQTKLLMAIAEDMQARQRAMIEGARQEIICLETSTPAGSSDGRLVSKALQEE